MAMTSLTLWATEAAASFPSSAIMFLVAIFEPFLPEVTGWYRATYCTMRASPTRRG
jgi:hypothetical protein